MVRKYIIKANWIALLISIYISFFSDSAKAQTFNFNSTTEGSAIQTASDIKTKGMPDTLVAYCNDWHNLVINSNWGSLYHFKSDNAFVKFYINHYYPKMTNNRYTYKLTYTLIGYKNTDTTNSSSYTTINDTLIVSYNPDSLTAYQDIQERKYSKFFKVKLILTGLYDLTDTTQPPVSINLNNLNNLNFNVEATIVTQRYDKQYYGTGTVVSTSAVNNGNNYLTVSWNPPLSTLNPVSYQLEWTYIDNYQVSLSNGNISYKGPSNLAYDFRHNSTRVWLDNNSYNIPLIYPRGYIVYRIRMVRPDSTLFEYPIYAPWTVSADSGVVSSASYYQIPTAYENDKFNWQYTVSFAEEGKFKHVLSFYDGLLKNRQSITRFNTDPNKLIVTENIYDYEGDPSLKILPTPISSSTFSYQPNVSINSATHQEYKASDFDTIRLQSCPSESLLSPLDSNLSLASIYYSHHNADTSSFQRFVPDAQGYPLIHTIYEPGYANRIQKQGGAGRKLQIADSNIITNDYVGAEQEDLNRLFGINIGYSGFYNKTVSRDPNRQLSMSVKDYKGRQILSSMLGTGPDANTHAIVPVDNVPGQTYFNEDLIAGTTQQTVNNQRILDKDFYMDAEGNDTIQYIFSYAPYPTPCPDKFLSVKAAYMYKVFDQCGNEKAYKSEVLGSTGVVNTATPIAYNGSKQSIYLGQGVNSVHKELTINPNDVSIAVDSFMNGPNCLKTKPTFIRASVETHHFPCPFITDECTAKKLKMMQELYPRAKYGQYQQYQGYVDGPNSIFTRIPFNGTTIYKYQDTCIKYHGPIVGANGVVYSNPNVTFRSITVDSFMAIFDDAVAEQLLPLHPEYCMLNSCFADTFKTRVLAIPDANTAENMGLLYLDSIIARDPMYDKLVNMGYASPKDSLGTFAASHISLDSFLIIEAYCGCNDSAMFNRCMSQTFNHEISSRLLVNDFVKSYYFKNLIQLYFQNRQRFVDRIQAQGISTEELKCAPCGDYRLFLIQPPVFPPQSNGTYVVNPTSPTSPGTLVLTDSTGLLTTLLNAANAANISPDSLNTLMDSAYAINNGADSVMCIGQIDSIVSKLNNCGAGNQTTLTRIKDSLAAICSRGEVLYGNFTPAQIRYAILTSGASLNDICNPYLISYLNTDPSQAGGGTSQDCKPDDFYMSIKKFLNKTSPLSALKDAAIHYTSNIYSDILSQNAADYFQNSMATELGTTNVNEYVTYSTTSNLYTLFIYYNTDTVRLFLRGSALTGACSNAFQQQAQDTISISDVKCINTVPVPMTIGFINQFSFIATVTHSMPSSITSCSLLGWTDSVESMAYSSNMLASCEPCTKMRQMYDRFADTMATLHVYGVDHPYYNTMLNNFMDFNFGKAYSLMKYQTFIQSCALADSLLMSNYVSYCSAMFQDSASAQKFINALNVVDASVSFYNLYREDSNSRVRVMVDFNQIPRQEYYKYINFINGYATYVNTSLGIYGSGNNGMLYKLVNHPLSTVQSSYEVGYIYTPTTSSFVPNAATIFGSGGTLYFNGPISRKVWTGTHFVSENVYTLNATATTHPAEISKDVYLLRNYIFNNSLATVFVSNNESTVNDDYFKPEKTAYLRNVYRLQPLLPFQVLDSLQPQYLMQDISLYQTNNDAVTYTNASNPNVVTNLYLAGNNQNNYLYDTLKFVLSTAANYSGNPNHTIFFSSDSEQIMGSPSLTHTNLTAFKCSDGSYWYRYFGKGDTMYNVYVRMPQYIPFSSYPAYRLVSVSPLSVSPLPGDSTTRFFTLNFSLNGTGPVVQATGMANFVLANNIELKDVLMNGGLLGGSGGTALTDTFNNCERQELQSAVIEGIYKYNQYIDSIRTLLTNGFLAYLMNGVGEKLYIGYRDQQFNYTIYYYDRAGNLMKTVPPQGVKPLNIATLGAVDTARTDHDTASAGLLPVHAKTSTYTYNSLNQVISEITPDGGKTLYFYDRAGQLVFSQNAKQATSGSYTYNLYDAQGRITETGEVGYGCPRFDEFLYYPNPNVPIHSFMYSIPNPDLPGQYETIITPHPELIRNAASHTMADIIPFVKSKNRLYVVNTIYDTMTTNLGLVASLSQQTNLRKRVAAVKYFESILASDTYYKNYTYATHYSYDAEGNVKTLVQDFPTLSYIHQQYKRIDYDYDLISGKVNMLSYNRGWADQYFQRYSYDADNRITEVETSPDGYIWTKDATYSYYEHGPLARATLGGLSIQGMDYAYTVQGWLKSVNSDTLNTVKDMGQDGNGNSVFAPDVVAGTIDYFDGDYKPIGNRPLTTIATPLTHNLYNGNIARQTVAIKPFPRLSKQYIYDQLNRINNATYSVVNPVNSTLTGLTPDYANDYKYDQDGNLLKLVRYGNKTSGGSAQLMDSLTYFYNSNNNQLRNVTDSANDITAYSNDIDKYTDTSTTRYLYDPTGNTIKDLVSGQDSIRWNMYNKVTQTNNRTAGNSMLFTYDGAGNRVAKYYTQTNDTGNTSENDYYVRDAQGNILAVYHESEVYKKEKGRWVFEVDNNFRNDANNGIFHAFVNDAVAWLPGFIPALVNYSMLDTNFVNQQLNISLGQMVHNDFAQYMNLLYANPNYIDTLVGAEQHHADSILGNAYWHMIDTPINQVAAKFANTLFTTKDMTPYMVYLLMMDGVGGPSDSASVFISEGGTPEQFVALHNSVDAILGLPSGSTMNNFSTSVSLVSKQVANPSFTTHLWTALEFDAPQHFKKYTEALATDPKIVNNAEFMGGKDDGPLVPVMQNAIAGYGDTAAIIKFFDQTGLGKGQVYQTSQIQDMLTARYNDSPSVYLDAFAAHYGEAYVDSSIAAIPTLQYLLYIHNINVWGGPPQLWQPTKDVLQRHSFYLAEHDIYGSSRLGIKGYWPLQKSMVWDYTTTPQYVDTIRLLSRLPWYSQDYQDVITPDSTSPYGGTYTATAAYSGMLGQKQYELTDHLGDVLATVSDKRKDQDVNDDGTIDYYTAAIPSAYDYYPFGMLMPGRYISDTSSHCALVTQSMLMPVLTFHPWTINPGTLVNVGGGTHSTGTGGTLVFSATNVGDGVSIPLSVDAGVGSTLQFKVTGLSNATFVAQLLDDANKNTVLSSLTITDLGTMTMSYRPPVSSAVHLVFTAQGIVHSPGSVIIDPGPAVMGYYTTTYQQQNVTTTICDRDNDKYRYGFNGKLKDNEWAGIGNSLDFGARMEDSRIGRFRNLDPMFKKFPNESPYIFGGDNPIFYVDKGGEKKTTFFTYINDKTHTTLHIKSVTPGLMSRTSYVSNFYGITVYAWYDYENDITFHVDKNGKTSMTQSGPILGKDRGVRTLTNSEGLAEHLVKTKDPRSISGWIGTSDEGGGADNRFEPSAAKGSRRVDYGELLKTIGRLSGFARESPTDAIETLEDLKGAVDLGTDMATDKNKKGIINVDSHKALCPSCNQYRDSSHIDEVNGKGTYEQQQKDPTSGGI